MATATAAQMPGGPEPGRPYAAVLRKSEPSDPARFRVLSRTAAGRTELPARLGHQRGGCNVAIMKPLTGTTTDQAPADQAGKPRTVFKNDTREIDYRMGGQMISLAVSDADASLKTPAPTVTVPMPSVSR